LDPTRKYMICCVPHGAYAFSGAIWIGPQFRLRLNPQYQHHQVVYSRGSCGDEGREAALRPETCV
jgi:hypothetical protein